MKKVNNITIDGAALRPLKQIPDERGKIMKMLGNEDEHFTKFGEIYFSCIHPGAIKAWHIHSKMWLNYAVPQGRIKLVLYDDREESPTKGHINEIFIGIDNYSLVTVPPFVWNGFKGYGQEMAIVANCASLYHDAGEIDRLDPFSSKIPYNWDLVNG